MLKYYSYYNVGGYKDMYLGDSAMKAEKAYFLPLLPLWKKKVGEGDKELADKVQSLDKLCSIDIISNDNLQGLPAEAMPLFSHGGYKIAMMIAKNGTPILAVRDIDSGKKDESGRNIPFLFVVTGSQDEVQTLCKMAVYVASHMDSCSKRISGLFEYDSEKNGLSFNLAEATEYLTKISQESDENLITVNGELKVSGKFDVPLFVLPEGINKELAAKEQNLSDKAVTFVRFSDILPLDNIQRLTWMLKGRKISNQSIFSERKVLYAIGGAAIFGFILGFLLTR